jgi:colanic acid/amylovoran biosynthesis glycosyltransferase
MSKPIVLIYAEPLLARSMTFIRTQAESLKSFTPYYVSPHCLRNGLPLPEERVAVMHREDTAVTRLAEIPFKFAGIAPFFVRRLRKLQPVLLHAHFGPMGLRALPLARALGIPLIVTFQGYDATVLDRYATSSQHYSHRVYVRRRKVLEQRAALLIAVSKFVRDELVRQGFAPDKVIVHQVGVDTELFCPKPDIKREPIILFVGRLAEKKGCEYLIRAVARIQASLPDLELVIIGDGELRTELENLAAQSLRRYRFLGFQSPDVVRQWMNRAQVFGAPSIRARSGDAEGYPNVFAEAQSMELPVISFNSDGVREAVVHGETGLLAPSRDCEVLAQNLRTLCVDDALRTRMGSAARARVCKNFNLSVQTSRLESLYMQLSGRRAIPAEVDSSAEGQREEIAALDS